MNKKFKFSIWYLIAAFWALIFLQEIYFAYKYQAQIPYSQFRNWVAENKVSEVAISETLV